MSQSVLIVEDEESAARLIADLCAELGLAARTTRSGREALSMLAPEPGGDQPFSCLVLDLVLAELDGFQVARTARGTSWGAALPIIVISGVYKQLPVEFLAQVRPAAFLPKPFEPSALREALMRIVKGNEAGAEGDFTQRPPGALLVDLLKQKATGTLTLTRGTTVRKLSLQAGQLRFAQSNVKAETAGAAQVASGLIKQATFDRAVADAKARKVPLHEALMSSRVLAPDQLKAALLQQTREVALGALGWADGSFRFEPQPPERVAALPDARTSTVSLVSEAAGRSGNLEDARSWLGQRAPQRITRSPELERDLFALRAAWPAEGVTALAQAGRSLHEILPRLKDAELPLLKALCESGLLQLTGADEVKPEVEDRGRVFSARETELRRQLILERDRLKDADHYALFGVAPSAPLADIKQAYFAAAKKFHSDTFAGQELGSARRIAEELFRRVAEAYAVLSDEKKRAEYDVFRDRKAKGLPTDVNAILRAEQIFVRGEAQYRNGKWDDAEACFREAVALNHAEAEFWGYLGISIYRSKGKAAEGLAHVEKALQMDGRLSSALAFAGILADALGDEKKALKLLEQALAENDKNQEAERELSRIRRQQEAAVREKGSVLSRLFGQNKSKGR